MRRIVVPAAAVLVGMAGSPAAAAAPEPPHLEVFLNRATDYLDFVTRPDVVAGRTAAGPAIGIRNLGGPASGIVLTVDLSELRDTVLVDSVGPGCARIEKTVVCEAGDLGYNGWTSLEPMKLRAVPGSAAAPAGRVTMRAVAVEGGPQRTAAWDVRVLQPGTDARVRTEARPLLPVPTRPDTEYLSVIVVNDGDEVLREPTLTFDVPRGIAVADLNQDPRCTHTGGAREGSRFWGPARVVCPLPGEIEPGVWHKLWESGSSPPRFYAMAGPNTPGPAPYPVTVTVTPREPDLDPTDNISKVPYHVAANKINAAVRAAVTRDGESATVSWTVTNHGPSDATGRTVTVTAPAGTELLPAAGCQVSAAKAVCASKDWLSAPGSVTGNLPLRIIGTPGDGGSVTVSGTGPSTETKPADNTVAIAVPPAGGSPTLPITGPSGALTAGVAAVLAGLSLVLLARRRRG